AVDVDRATVAELAGHNRRPRVQQASAIVRNRPRRASEVDAAGDDAAVIDVGQAIARGDRRAGDSIDGADRAAGDDRDYVVVAGVVPAAGQQDAGGADAIAGVAGNRAADHIAG